MHPLSPFFCIIIFFIAFATAFLLKKIYNIKAATGRYESIDGLRGFLAIGVFIPQYGINICRVEIGLCQNLIYTLSLAKQVYRYFL
jgi:hypothetical protein